MAKKIADLISLLVNAGLTIDPATITTITTSGEIPDDVYGNIEAHSKNLFTLESAKHHPQLAAHFKSQSLLPVDSEIKRLMDELGFDDTIKGEFEAEKSTYKKIGLLANKVKELEAKKSSSPADKKALQDEITKLNNQLLQAKNDFAAQLKAKEEEAGSQILNYAIESHLGSKQYADSIPESIRVSGAMSLLNKELAAKGAKVVRSADNSLKLVRVDNPDLDFTENNKPVSFGEFADKTLSTHAMLKVSGPPAKPASTPIQKIDSTQETDASKMHIAALESDIAALEAATR